MTARFYLDMHILTAFFSGIHLLVIVDTMIKKHVRRIPVTDAGEVVGIVYRSAVFYHLLQKVMS